MMKEDQDKTTFKVMLTGDAGTGKTSLVTRLTKQAFVAAAKNSDLINVDTHEFEIKSNNRVIACIWDLAGGQECRSITQSAYHAASGVILVYDISNAATFAAIPDWLKLARGACDPKKIILLGNKTDLVKSRAVSTKEAQTFATENDLLFMETSALNGDHVESAFQQIIIALTDIDLQETSLQAVHTDTQETPFQVVLVDRKSAADGDIICVEKPLHGDLKFVALSYRWGELHESMVDTHLGYIATITSFNLFDFCELCLTMEYDPDLKQMDYVWVDAICVNQTNYERRKATIYHMSEIYEHANYILAVPDLHLQHLKDTSSNTQNIIEYCYDYKNYLNYHFHGSYERLYELDEAFLDDIGIPKHPDIRQWLTNENDFLTQGFTKFEILHRFYNPLDTLEHLCEVIHDVYQPSTATSTNGSFKTAVPDIDYNVHYCNKPTCPLDAYYYNVNPWWQKAKYPENFDSKPKAIRWDRKILDRSTKIRQVIKRFIELMMDWSTRAWVISELSIARKNNNLKYWFLHNSPESYAPFYPSALAPGFTFYNFDFDKPVVSLAEKPNILSLHGDIKLSEPICQEFHNMMIKQLNDQTFLEKMLKSKASRHEDRFYAVLPSSPYKYILNSRDVVSSWNIQSMLSVKLKLYEWMTTMDKLNLFFLSGHWHSLTWHPVSPTFATSSIYWEDASVRYPPVGDLRSDCSFDLDKSDSIQLVPPADSGSSKYCLCVKPKEYHMATAATASSYFAKYFPEYETVCERMQIDHRNDVNVVCISPLTIARTEGDDDSFHNSVYLFGSMTENKWEIHKLRPEGLLTMDFEGYDVAFSRVCFDIY